MRGRPQLLKYFYKYSIPALQEYAKDMRQNFDVQLVGEPCTSRERTEEERPQPCTSRERTIHSQSQGGGVSGSLRIYQKRLKPWWLLLSSREEQNR
ncbi:hypothetical protein QQF64_022450 [Cirrhinus molitorella]|uniref:Uncharacterized protein n=1 Tax=Cirrhinus molitorella TaxID=172907 RepID=A0ABR3L5P4_9TELE